MKKNKVIGTSLVVIVSLAAAFAYARPSQSVRTTYYDSKGKVVGGSYTSCGGGISKWGKQTAQYSSESDPCF
ncbi:DUF6289 family protein [Undibacterium fentianense]|uniref:Uncharacterized protein n=1 Tax=Undibacterium fentianense TaxID=2828728 RepID=A0A941IEK9_9BURK|nr:DUF6289 family protein [Undibacterium fentianense]MBR7799741.1 hypothetical protein [Undibacterium fentianense]